MELLSTSIAPPCGPITRRSMPCSVFCISGPAPRKIAERNFVLPAVVPASAASGALRSAEERTPALRACETVVK